MDLLKCKKVFRSLEDEIKYINIDDDRIEVVSSDLCGVGKSTYIKLKIKQKEKKEYIHFPFGGEFNRKNIIKRLTNLKITKNSVIHLDLYDTDQVDLMLKFLFSILITKFYRQNEDLFCLPNNIGIKIEIPNGFIDFIKKFPILALFRSTKLTTIFLRI